MLGASSLLKVHGKDFKVVVIVQDRVRTRPGLAPDTCTLGIVLMPKLEGCM